MQPDLSVKEDVNTGDRTGVRAAVKIAPSDHLTITPRIVYQQVEADGWNRIDTFNILANPFTTTRPAVTLGEREQFTQIEEPFTDEFMLADLNIALRLRRRRASRRSRPTPTATSWSCATPAR